MSTTNEQGATSMHLPPSIDHYVKAENAGDVELLSECFAPVVGGGDAARAARFAWLLASPGIGREENQQLRDGSFLPARTLQAGVLRRGGGGVGVVGLQQVRSVPGRAGLCVVWA